MEGSNKQAMWVVGIIVALPLLFLVTWGWVLGQRDILDSSMARNFSWPIACSMRGCLTTTSWEQHYQARVAFAVANEQSTPSTTDALTTLVRQHLVRNAFLRVPVTKQDAVRYREEILNAKDEVTVQEATGLTLDDYDKLVILPLLQQEALRQEQSVESFDELFQLLASERAVVVLAFRLSWDKETAKVVTQ
jgi:hypothetical protein